MADMENTNVAAENATGATQQPTTMSFDEMLKSNPAYQSEFDRRMSKGTTTAVENAKKTFVDTDANAKIEALTGQLNTYIRREAIARAGVAEQFTDYVLFTVGNKGGDFNAALTQFIADNPHFAKQNAEQPTPAPNAKAWAGNQTDTVQAHQPDGVEAAFLKRNPNLKV